MEIDRLTHGSMAGMFGACDTDLHDEIEAVYAGEALGRAAIQRLLEYLRSTGARRQKGGDVKTSTSLDVAVDLPDRLGPVRVTLSGDKVIQAALLARGDAAGWSTATVMHKRRLRPSVDVHEHRFRVNMKREEPVTDAAEVNAAIASAASLERGSRKVYRLKRRFSFPSADPVFVYDVTAVRQLTHPSPTWAELSAVPEKFEVECEYVSAGDDRGDGGDKGDRGDKDKDRDKRAASLASALLRCFGTLLKVLDDTDRLMTVSQRDAVLTEFLTLMYPSDKATWTAQVAAGTLSHRFLPGPKPVTLEFQHLIEHAGQGRRRGRSRPDRKDGVQCEDEIEQGNEGRGSVSVVGGTPYTVTEKADGTHRVLFITSKGSAYTLAVDGVVKVRDTGLSCRAGGRGTLSILDGEYIGANSSTGSLFAAYDAFFFEGADVRRLELMREDEESKSSRMAVQVDGQKDRDKDKDKDRDRDKVQRSRPPPLSRLAACQMVSASLSQPPATPDAAVATTRVLVKRFLRYEGDMDGLTSCVRKVLARRDAKNFPYSIDGIILTPAAWPMGAMSLDAPVQSSSTWHATMKWKPPDQNSIDFLVRFIPGETVRRDNQSFKVAHLFVGCSPATWDPVTTLALLTDAASPSARKAAGAYVERLFSIPGEPPQKAGLHVCHLKVEDGDRVVCSSGEDVMDATIVEFTYDMTAGAGLPPSFRWIPLRPRPDKTQRFVTSGGEIGGAANDIGSALSVWMSIQHPITEDIMCGRAEVQKGRRGEEASAEEMATAAYYLNKTRPGDGGMAAMRDFHNWVKSVDLLLRVKGNTTRSLFDVGCGRAGDLHSWLKLGVTRVLGVDLSRTGIVEPENGANVRIMEMKRRGMGKGVRHAPFPRIVLLPMDASRPIDAMQIDAMEDESDRQVARVVWSLVDSSSVKDERLRRYHGFASGGFDVVSCQFAVHYFFKTPDTLRAFASNVARHIRRGGYFLGTCMDAHRVNEAFGDKQCMQGVAGGKVIWRIQRLYDRFEPSEDFQGNTGLRIKVYVQTIGQPLDEFLVDYRLLRAAMAEVGLVPPDSDQLTQLGLDERDAPGGTCTFEAIHTRMRKEWERVEAAGHAAGGQGADKHVTAALGMTDDEKGFSFLNRWFIFVKSDRASRESRRHD